MAGSLWKRTAPAACGRTARGSSAGRAARTPGGNGMSPNGIAVPVLAAVASIGVAFACGPFFPWQLFDDRDATVAEPVGLGFAFEASRLVPVPHDGLRGVEA